MPPIDPFIETPALRIPPATTSGSDTTPFDRFRQGVEVTSQAYRALGLYKAGTGTDDHSLEQTEFGQVIELEPSLTYTDRTGYAPLTYMSGGMTLPFPLDEMRGGFAELYDGVLEPLAIRMPAAHASIDFPVDHHAIKAGLQAGNVDVMGRADQVVSTRLVYGTGASPFFDAQETFGDVALPGFVSDVVPVVPPFDDVKRVLTVDKLPSGSSVSSATSLLRDVVMEELVAASTGGLEPLLPLGHVSMPSGYSYDTPLQKLVVTSSGTNEFASLKAKTPYAYGTDSIAFGGLLQ